jgi:hypothetical protein
MELIDEGMSKSKAYQISMLSILAAVIFLMRTFLFFLPISVGMFALYFFREFKDVVVKALYIKNVMVFLIIVMFYPDLFGIIYLILLTVSDMFMGVIAAQGNFNFSNFTVLKMSTISQIPLIFPFALLTAPTAMAISGAITLGVLYCFPILITAAGLSCIATGFANLLGFKITVRIVEKIPNMITISRKHVGF